MSSILELGWNLDRGIQQNAECIISIKYMTELFSGSHFDEEEEVDVTKSSYSVDLPPYSNLSSQLLSSPCPLRVNQASVM